MESPGVVSPGPDVAEGGVSITRTGDEATQLRHRLERPARVGRVILSLLGAITAGAGIADWITTRSAAGIAIGVFGVVLLALGMIQHVLYRRDLRHWPTDVVLWDEGVELVLPNGEVRGASWSDPDLGLQLISRPAPSPANQEYLLLWLSDSKIPAVEISADGFDRISKLAVDRGLQTTVTHRGSRTRGTKIIHIHHYTVTSPKEAAKTTKSDG